jgi:hypothetical protein
LLVNRSFPADEVPSKPAVITSSVIAASAGTAKVMEAPTRSPVAPFQAVAATPSTSWEGRSLLFATVDETLTADGPPQSKLTGGARAADGAEPDEGLAGAEAEPTATDETEAASGGDAVADERVQAVNSRSATGARQRVRRRSRGRRGVLRKRMARG